MGIDTEGKVLVTCKVENPGDRYMAEEGRLPVEAVRRVEVEDALVDTDATRLALPGRLIRQLGLDPIQSLRPSTAAGMASPRRFGAVLVTIQDRDCLSEVIESPEDGPVRIGRVPLQLLDFVVDPKSRRLIGNPEHGGEHMIELY